MKANKKYPGGGLLRGEYSNGGAVYGYGMSRGQGAAALASRPAVKPAVKPAAVKPTATTTAKPTTATKPVATATVKPTTATSTTAKPAASASGSFSKAFADARAKGLKEFTWNGKRYTTQLKSEVAAKPQATQTRSAEPIQKMPVKVVTSITKPYFESPTGVMKPSEVRTTEMRDFPIEKMPVKTPTSVQASTDKGNQYFKPGTMAEYLEERRRKMRGQSIAGLMTKR